jgi:hypothetical protein
MREGGGGAASAGVVATVAPHSTCLQHSSHPLFPNALCRPRPSRLHAVRPFSRGSGGGGGGGLIAYPRNVNLPDFLRFSFAPTLCYDLNYPTDQHPIRVGGWRMAKWFDELPRTGGILSASNRPRDRSL